MNIYDLPQLPLPQELVTILKEDERVRIERVISTGQVSDWYDQNETEFVILLEGRAKIQYENGRTVELLKGDTVFIRPHEKHRVCYTTSEPPCIWLCIFWK